MSNSQASIYIYICRMASGGSGSCVSNSQASTQCRLQQGGGQVSDGSVVPLGRGSRVSDCHASLQTLMCHRGCGRVSDCKASLGP